MRDILITGTGRGLGMSLLQAHREQGDRVFGLTLNITPELKEIAETDDKVFAFEADISSTESIEMVMDEVAKFTSDLSVIYNNAGLYYQGEEGHREILDYDLDNMMRMYSVNAIGALRVTKAALKRRLLHEGATICNTSSEAGSIADMDAARTAEYGYCMSKCALNKASTLLYNDIGRKGMRVICIHPGWMRTKMGGSSAVLSPMSVAPEETAAGFLKLTNDFNSTDREHMFFRFNGDPIGW